MMIVSDLKAVVHSMSFWVLTVIVLLLNLQRNKMIKAGDGGDVLCVCGVCNLFRDIAISCSTR